MTWSGAQVQCIRELAAPRRMRWHETAGGVAEREEAPPPPALRLVAVHRERVVAPSARMRHVVAAAAERAVHPGVDDVERQRRVDGNGGVQRGRRLPGAVAHARDELAAPARQVQGSRAQYLSLFDASSAATL